jgi:hypothetical protein
MIDAPLISVDYREGSIDLLPTLQQVASAICTAKSAVLPRITASSMVGGDFCFDGLGFDGKRISVGIERKRLHSKHSDIISSIRTGRYAGHQLIEMNDLYDDCYLIIEGYHRCGPTGELETLFTRADDTGAHLGGKWLPVTLGTSTIRYLELEHWINTMNRFTKVCVSTSNTPWETAAQIISLYTHYQSPAEDHHAHQALHVPQNVMTLGKASLVRRVAAQLDGIGWEKSGAMDLKFRSVSDMCDAAPGEFVMPGIGKVLSQRAFDQLHGNHKMRGEL